MRLRRNHAAIALTRGEQQRVQFPRRRNFSVYRRSKPIRGNFRRPVICRSAHELVRCGTFQTFALVRPTGGSGPLRPLADASDAASQRPQNSHSCITQHFHMSDSCRADFPVIRKEISRSRFRPVQSINTLQRLDCFWQTQLFYQWLPSSSLRISD